MSGVEDLVGDGEAGFLVDLDAGRLAAALSALADDPAARSRLGAVARERSTAYTWKCSTDAVLTVYGSILDAPVSSLEAIAT